MSEEEKNQSKDERLEAQRFAASSIGTMEYWDAYQGEELRHEGMDAE
jgi:hypothetical protein